MNRTEIVVHGTLKLDGTLELDQKPSLSPGRVTVILQPAQAGTPRRGLANAIDEIRQGQQARGFQGRSAKEIEAGLREGEDEYEQRERSGRKPHPGQPQGIADALLPGHQHRHLCSRRTTAFSAACPQSHCCS